MWPDKVLRQFATVPANPSEGDYHAPYNKLLYTLFPTDTDFVVSPQFIPDSRGSADVIVMFEVLYQNLPVLILELNPPGHLSLVSKRRAADLQIRSRFTDAVEACPISTMYGISAMGPRLCFYTADLTLPNVRIMPTSIRSPDPEYIVDTAPAHRWEYDILTPQGEGKLREVVEAIKTACANLPS